MVAGCGCRVAQSVDCTLMRLPGAGCVLCSLPFASTVAGHALRSICLNRAIERVGASAIAFSNDRSEGIFAQESALRLLGAPPFDVETDVETDAETV